MTAKSSASLDSLPSFFFFLPVFFFLAKGEVGAGAARFFDFFFFFLAGARGEPRGCPAGGVPVDESSEGCQPRAGASTSAAWLGGVGRAPTVGAAGLRKVRALKTLEEVWEVAG